MEALIAVGLAGNVVTFVQTTAKLITEANEIRRNGGPSSVGILNDLTKTLTTHARCFKSHLRECDAALNQEDQYVLEVAEQCEAAGTSFLNYLDISLSRVTSKNPFRNVQASLKLHWKHHKIEEFISKLDRLRSALTLATVLALRISEHRSNEEVVTHLVKLQENSQHVIGAGTSLYQTIQVIAQSVHGEAEETRKLIHKLYQNSINGISQQQTGNYQTREIEILDWLDFRQITWKLDEIDLAYKKTFEWVYQEPPRENGWSDFVNFLSKPNVVVPYFVNGKAGSGKSTLMKFICNNPETTSTLQIWSKEDKLLLVSFHASNPGTYLQNSENGMLRAIIYAVLKEYRELIPAAFPKLYQTWKPSDKAIEPTRTELVKALELILKRSSSFLKLCIFVDGIDAFHGNFKEISFYLRSIVSNNVKIIISSRPINASLIAFRGCPTLQLQNLTRRDIDTFIHGELCSHPKMKCLIRIFPEKAQRLLNDIKFRAEGVFLWVKLVVRLLVEGLEEGDELDELRTKLHSLPLDLRNLYRRMIERMDPEHQIQAAQIFLLVQTWRTYVPNEPLSALILSYATQHASDIFDLPCNPIDSDLLNWTLENLENRIRSRCCGLLELEPQWTTSSVGTKIFRYCSWDEVQGSEVKYMHRTVAEFLTSTDVWDDISSMAGDTGFEPIRALIVAYICLIKRETDFFYRAMTSNLLLVVRLCREAPGISYPELLVYLTNINKAMNTHWENLAKAESMRPFDRNTHWSAEFFPVRNIENLDAQAQLNQNASIDTFAARMGLTIYLKSIDLRRGDPRNGGILLNAIESWRGLYWQKEYDSSCTNPISLYARSKTLAFLLSKLAFPGLDAFGIDLWDRALMVSNELYHQSRDTEAVELLRIFFCSTREPATLMRHRTIQDCNGEAVESDILIEKLLQHKSEETTQFRRELEQVSITLPTEGSGT